MKRERAMRSHRENVSLPVCMGGRSEDSFRELVHCFRCVFRDRTQESGLRSKCCYPLSHILRPLFVGCECTWMLSWK